ncbi:GOLPH3/VPS74 family protein [Kineococcus sp. SYSU DK006]|uniref:GOLPH3/VPS74 family protein n=1 Tax=Kineococcus sp. SYSU DK006 TaxID=3383127 RepID=UPI003D7E72C8
MPGKAGGERALVDDLALLTLSPATGRPLTDANRTPPLLAGALLMDLALRERVVAGERSRWWGWQLEVVDTSPTGDALLDEALGRLRRRSVHARGAVQRIGGHRTAGAVRRRLVRDGMVRHEPGGFLRLNRWYPDAAARDELVAAVAAALEAPDPAAVPPRTASLVSLLHAVGALGKVVPQLGLSRGELRERGKAFADGDWAGQAVSAAVQAAQAAVMSAVVTTTVVTAGASS